MLTLDSLPSRSCFEAFTENMTGETQLLELRRLYHCAAYNCAIAAISCSFSQPKFYTGFLFTEKPEKVGPGSETQVLRDGDTNPPKSEKTLISLFRISSF